MTKDLFNCLQDLTLSNNQDTQYYSLPALEKNGLGQISRLPV